MKYNLFPGPVCQRLRNLVGREEALEAERKRMFEARDEAKGQLQRLTNGEKTKRERLEADFGHAVIEIDVLDKSIKWCRSEQRKLIKRPDEAGLFDDVEVQLPDFRAADEKKAEDAGGDEGDNAGDEEPKRPPVGRSDAPPPAAEPNPAEEPKQAPLELKFPGQFCIMRVASHGPLRETGLFGQVPCGDRERLDAWIEQAIGTDRFTLSSDGVVTSNNVRMLHVTRIGEAPGAAPVDEQKQANGRIPVVEVSIASTKPAGRKKSGGKKARR